LEQLDERATAVIKTAAAKLGELAAEGEAVALAVRFRGPDWSPVVNPRVCPWLQRIYRDYTEHNVCNIEHEDKT
jgi:hypothetical protein